MIRSMCIKTASEEILTHTFIASSLTGLVWFHNEESSSEFDKCSRYGDVHSLASWNDLHILPCLICNVDEGGGETWSAVVPQEPQ